MSTRARATSMRAIRHDARRLTARARAAQALLASGRRGLLPSLPTDQLWYRDRNFTQPWVYPFDLEQQVQGVYDPSGFPRPWALGADLLGGAGSFASSTGWTLGTGWSISSGVATGATATTSLYTSASVGITAGKSYVVTVTVTAYTSGTVRCNLGGAVNGAIRSGIGTFSETVSATGGDGRLYMVVSNFAGSIDNITVQEVTLDQSWLGSDLLAGRGAFSNPADWSTPVAGASVTGGALTFDGSTSIGGGAQITAAVPALALLAGRCYQITYTIVGGTTLPISVGLTTGSILGTPQSAAGTYTEILVPTSNANVQVLTRTNAGARTGSVDNISVREIPGNPLVSPSAGNGPVATARVNELQHTENQAAAAWSKVRLAAVTGNNLIATAVNDTHFSQQGSMTSGVQYNWYAEVEDTGARYFHIAQAVTLARSIIIDLQTGTASHTGGNVSNVSITARTGGGWVVRAKYIAQATAGITVGPAASNSLTFTGDGTSGVRVHRVDCRPAVYDSLNLPAYQRVGDGTAGVFDYDHVGFPVWFTRGAANRGLVSLGTLDLTATDAVSAGMVALKTSDAALSALLETSPTVFSNNGAFWFGAPDANNSANVQFRAGGTFKDAIVRSSLAAPQILTLLGESKIATDTLKLTVNSSQTTSAGDQGTGNYGNHRVNIGGRDLAGTPSLSFTGFYLLPLIADANAISADLAAEVLREMAASVNHYY